MKFLSNHGIVKDKLESWAHGKKLVLARLFFWKSGDKLKMSVEGLYRSLLFEVLRQCPELRPQVFPNLWNSDDSGKLGFEGGPCGFLSWKRSSTY